MASSQKGKRYIQDVMDYSRELLEKEDHSGLRIRDIIGFEVPKGATVFLPYVKCIPTVALLPMYDTLIVGIGKVENIKHMKDKTGLTFDDIVTLAQKEKLVLYVDVDCPLCLDDMSNVIYEFVDREVPLFFGPLQSTLLALKTSTPSEVDVNGGRQLLVNLARAGGKKEERALEKVKTLATKMAHLRGLQQPLDEFMWLPFLMTCASMKPTSEYIRHLIEVGTSKRQKEYVSALRRRLYMIPKLFIAKAFDSTFSTNVGCRYFYEGETNSKETPTEVVYAEQLDPYELEFIEKKLHIGYSESIPLAEYSDLFDSRITNSLRQTVRRILTMSRQKGKSFITLQNALDDYNRQVEELATRSTRRTKMVYAMTDILRSNAGAIRLLMEGIAEKYLNAPHKAWDCFVVPKGYRHTISKWLQEKTLNLESRLAGASPEIIHLYRTRTCLEKLKKRPKS